MGLESRGMVADSWKWICMTGSPRLRLNGQPPYAYARAGGLAYLRPGSALSRWMVDGDRVVEK